MVRVNSFKKMRKLKYLPFALAFVAPIALAAIIPSQVTRVTSVSAYSQYGGGDVVVTIENPVAECNYGYFLSKSDAGFSATLALLVAAQMNKSAVLVHGHADILWNGSAGKYCKIYAVQIQ